MVGAPVVVRTAEPDEVPQIVSTIVAAFLTDPFARFGWPTPHDYLEAMPRVAGEFARASVDNGTADVTSDIAGVAFWLPPGATADGEVLSQVFRDTVAADRMGDMAATFEAMVGHHSDEPYWRLPMIGVEPNAQGRGLGTALMQYALARCDEDGGAAYLESSNPRNVSLYERHGFEPVAGIKIGAAPLITPMMRSPY